MFKEIVNPLIDYNFLMSGYFISFITFLIASMVCKMEYNFNARDVDVQGSDSCLLMWLSHIHYIFLQH